MNRPYDLSTSNDLTMSAADAESPFRSPRVSIHSSTPFGPSRTPSKFLALPWATPSVSTSLHEDDTGPPEAFDVGEWNEPPQSEGTQELDEDSELQAEIISGEQGWADAGSQMEFHDTETDDFADELEGESESDWHIQADGDNTGEQEFDQADLQEAEEEDEDESQSWDLAAMTGEAAPFGSEFSFDTEESQTELDSGAGEEAELRGDLSDEAEFDSRRFDEPEDITADNERPGPGTGRWQLQDTFERSSDEAGQAPAGGPIPAGLIAVEKVPMLRRHAGIGPDLIVSWNAMAATPTAVDVIVHLHGYSLSRGAKLHIVRDLKPRSGLDWSDPTGVDPGRGRRRPTLALLPRGHFFGGTGERGYSFPALTTQAGFRQLIDFGLERLGKVLAAGGLRADRLILTAHSGGGAALLKILKHVDPHEVHVFDGLYQEADPLIRWATSRIARDQNVVAAQTGPAERYMAERGGALRVLYRAGTAHHSRIVADALRTAIVPGSPLRRWYRVERTATGHVQIPPVYGWRILADAAADLPGVPYVPPAKVASPSPAREGLYEEFEGATTGSSLRARIVAIAKEEWQRWGRGTKKELSPEVTRFLQEYYSVGIGRTVSARDLQNSSWQFNHPWSAVFISFVMKKAGAGDAFKYDPLHATYVCAAKKARTAKPTADPSKFWAYHISETKPEAGDLVCKDRIVKGRCGGTTYETVCNGGKAHCDIVIEVDRTKNQIKTIGGNVNQSVDIKTISLADSGHLPERARDGCRWIAVLKPPGRSAVANGNALGILTSLPSRLANAVRQGAITLQVALALASGQRDLNTLTNLLFYAKHPELPTGYRIQRHEKHLARDWVALRTSVILPLVQALSIKAPMPTAQPAPALVRGSESTTVGTAGSAPVPADLGTLVVRRPGQPEFRYTFSRDDLEWTARLISGEAGAKDDRENRAVIAAMLNRFGLFAHRVYPTFSAFLRAYSTPLQPVLLNKQVAAHYANDSRFRRLGGTYPGTTIARGQLQHHLDLQQTPWDRLLPLARRLALEALTGRMAETGIGLASEFASTWILYGRHVGSANRTDAGWLVFTQNFRRDKGWRWIGSQPTLDQKRNAFFVDPRAAGLPADSVRIVPPA